MYENLPDKLKQAARFCLWRYEERNGKMTKVPYQTNGHRADPADKNTFMDFRLALVMLLRITPASAWAYLMISVPSISTTAFMTES